ncbi:hypothetical protein VTK26DRAFT_2016 [Humicola hyalothermophila]
MGCGRSHRPRFARARKRHPEHCVSLRFWTPCLSKRVRSCYFVLKPLVHCDWKMLSKLRSERSLDTPMKTKENSSSQMTDWNVFGQNHTTALATQPSKNCASPLQLISAIRSAPPQPSPLPHTPSAEAVGWASTSSVSNGFANSVKPNPRSGR